MILSTILDFVKLLALVSIISFVLYKIFSPIREKVAEKYSLSWTKSALLVDFVCVVVLILVTCIYFIYLGAVLAGPIDPELDYNLIDYAVLILACIPRVIIASIALSLMLLFFELVASMFMSSKKEGKKNKGKSNWVNQITGIAVSSALFLMLVLFVFNWVPLGIFIYIFYGTLEALPALILF